MAFGFSSKTIADGNGYLCARVGFFMREILLFFSYILCAFVSALVFLKLGRDLSLGAFWATWFISLIGAFAGGYLGTILINRAGLNPDFIGSLLAGFAGSWLLAGFFLRIKKIPGNW